MIDPIHYSQIKYMALSPAHFRHACDHPRADTDAMRVGRAGHAAILTGQSFPTWEGDRRAGKAWGEFLSACRGDYVRPAEAAVIHEMCDAIRQHPLARRLCSEGDSEVSVEWTHAATGLVCAGRLDKRTPERVCDLKTIKDISRRSIERAVIGLHYHVQAAMYLCATGAQDFRWIFVESVPPHCVLIARPTDALIGAGAALYDKWMAQVSACLRSGEWPGPGVDEIEIDVPQWAVDAPALDLDGEPL